MRRAHPLSDWLLLLALVALWGSSFALIKLALATLPPLTVVAGRLVIAAVVLIGWVYASGRRLKLSARLWLFLIAMAVTGNCLPFFLISWGQQFIDSALAGILMAVMPLVTLALAHFLVADEHIDPAKIFGFVLGFAGIVTLLGPESLRAWQGSDLPLLAELAVLGGAFCYAVNTIVARRRPASDALQAAAGVALAASVLMTPLAVISERPWTLAPAGTSLLALGVLGVFSTAVATVLYFRLITSAGPTFLAMINYLIPLWAVMTGALFLGEQPGWNALGALVLILTGIALAQWPRR